MEKLIAVALGGLIFAGTGVAHGLDGMRDVTDDFRFVVQITSSIGNCTGVVDVRGLVSTAAHCVWSTNGWAKNLRIKFKDADGISHIVGSKKILVPPEYQERRSSGGSNESTFYDMAFIIPDGLVQTSQYIHMVT